MVCCRVGIGVPNFWIIAATTIGGQRGFWAENLLFR